ncbi:hypothetical protein M3Y96_00245500 [Aphelenchoides besseyi]|nr:hypothetical protein M3Y96_00245500 [Aphelenchoides besseyi]
MLLYICVLILFIPILLINCNKKCREQQMKPQESRPKTSVKATPSKMAVPSVVEEKKPIEVEDPRLAAEIAAAKKAMLNREQAKKKSTPLISEYVQATTKNDQMVSRYVQDKNE